MMSSENRSHFSASCSKAGRRLALAFPRLGGERLRSGSLRSAYSRGS
ncbi:hypothetical protein CUJ84_Chr000066 [Rhizobium leguminosarum]|uniref:Uncharacterized protein n=1 Tax=Rhizobium leguminosarum TaxID=384 RepID=A0A2K9YWZ0_RHILE|nr:hypothetical protein CUJ84_Chr000066 [Rhizobium leguminosarum]